MTFLIMIHFINIETQIVDNYKGNFKYDLTNYRLIDNYNENLLVYELIN